MEHYLQQLIKKLDSAASNPPEKPYDAELLNWEVDPVASEMSLVPYKSIEEWTGIKKSSFPDTFRLSGNQCQQVNEAVLKVYKSLNLTIVDLPDDVHPMFLYVAIVLNWDYPVQYLPLSGTELRFFNDEDEEKYLNAMSGLFNDDGTKVDIDSVPLPSLCVICKLHTTEDWEEDLLCLMNRNDQRNEESFECDKFEKV